MGGRRIGDIRWYLGFFLSLVSISCKFKRFISGVYTAAGTSVVCILIDFLLINSALFPLKLALSVPVAFIVED